MNRSVKKARFICKAYKKSANSIISEINKIEENKEWEVVKPQFSTSEEQKLTQQIHQTQKEAKTQNIINRYTQKYEIPRQPTDEEHSKDEYKVELLSYGYVADTITTDIKEKAIRFYCKFDSSSDFAFRFYINDNLIPYKEIRKTLGVTQKHIFKYYKSY